ncbi:MAG: ATP-binding protein [Kiloniellales bacterium]|nr:ATP-binding protein [Kiloniellales bacterium]
MAVSANSLGSTKPGASIDASSILNTLPEAVVALDSAERFAYVNQAAEQFFKTSAPGLLGRGLGDYLPQDSPVFGIIRHAREGGHSVSQTGLTIDSPKLGTRFVSIEAAPMSERPDHTVVSLQERSIARKIDHQLVHRNAARSVTAMAAMLAHEVKNPLSGIRGAAQLLERQADPNDVTLTRLICDEADRIVALVDRMEMFADQRPIERSAVNIHEVLEHVRGLAQAGFARRVTFHESYDPSLPPVYGNRDLLIQVFLNLIKNAAEVVPEQDGRVTLSTRYQHGVRLAVPGSGSRVDLPLTVVVEDNGPGIPEDLQAHLFEAFVTTKIGGRGLGLALVAKIVGDHGGVVEFDCEPGRTRFKVMLPKADPSTIGAREAGARSR